jgi:hypothetical protein
MAALSWGWRSVAAGAVAFVLLAGCNAGDPTASADPVSTDAGDCCAEAARDENPALKFVGVWDPIGSPRDLESEAEPVFTPAAQKSIERQKELRDAGNISYDYSAICIPPASATMTTLGPQEILVDEEKITWIIEATSGIRWVWLDGREHPPVEELRPTANGHAIGRWDGDVLVIDSLSFLDKAMVYVNMAGNVSIYPSPEMRFVERLRLVEDGNAIISERTLHDPVNLKEPWKTKVRYERRDDWEIGETICMENNNVFFYFEPDDLPGANAGIAAEEYVE